MIRLRMMTAVLASSLLGTGCAYVQPYVFPQAQQSCGTTPTAGEACQKLPALKAAVTTIDNSASAVEDKLVGLGGVTTVNRALNLATFAGATALVAKTVLNGSDRSKKNLGLATGAAYAGSTLFTPASTESLYLASHASLVCIAGKGDALLASYGAAAQTNEDIDTEIRSYLDNPACPTDKKNEALIAATIKARVARRSALAALAQVRAADGMISAKLNQAASNVLLELNRQLLASNPSADAILQAARSVSTVAVGTFDGPTPVVTRAVNCPALNEGELDAVADRYDAVREALAQQLNAVGDLGNACTATAAVPLKPLALSQADIDVIANRTTTVVISGGRPPYRAYWVGTAPADSEVIKQMFAENGLLHVSAPSTAKEATFTLQVSDAAVVPSTASLTVRTHPTK